MKTPKRRSPTLSDINKMISRMSESSLAVLKDQFFLAHQLNKIIKNQNLSIEQVAEGLDMPLDKFKKTLKGCQALTLKDWMNIIKYSSKREEELLYAQETIALADQKFEERRDKQAESHEET